MSDLVPNEGNLFGVPINQEREIENKKEKAKVLEVAEFIEAELAWCYAQKAEAEKLTNIDLESKVSVESQVMAYQMLAELLTNKKGELQAIADQYIKR